MAFDADEFKGPNGVNVAEILRVADAIERSLTFDMGFVWHDCGTPACILGHAAAVAGVPMDDADREWGAKFFGITPQQSADLFLMSDRVVMVSKKLTSADWAFMDAPQEHGVAVLRNLAATGLVDWLSTKPA